MTLEEDPKNLKEDEFIQAGDLTTIDVYIDFYSLSSEQSSDRTVVQFLKGENMSHFSYKTLFYSFKNYIFKENK